MNTQKQKPLIHSPGLQYGQAKKIREYLLQKYGHSPTTKTIQNTARGKHNSAYAEQVSEAIRAIIHS